MSKPDGQCCGKCKWLDVGANKAGKIRVQWDASYLCRFPIGALPPMPQSVPVNDGWQAIKWPPSFKYIGARDGASCQVFEARNG